MKLFSTLGILKNKGVKDKSYLLYRQKIFLSHQKQRFVFTFVMQLVALYAASVSSCGANVAFSPAIRVTVCQQPANGCGFSSCTATFPSA